MHLNRIVAVLTALAGIAGAIAVPLGNLDTHSTTGVVAGLATILTAAVTWLVGWQKHEARVAPTGPQDLADPALDEPAPAGPPAPALDQHQFLASSADDVAERDARDQAAPNA